MSVQRVEYDMQFLATTDASHFSGERAIQHVAPGQAIMLSAASFEAVSRARRQPGKLFTPDIPEHITEVAVDPGGFMAQMRYDGYRFSWDEYERWLFSLGPRLSWAALPDLPCEKELASDEYAVRQRQETTLKYAHEVWGTVFQPGTDEIDDTEGTDYRRDFPWAWVATVQGRSVSEYVWMARELEPLLALQHKEYEGIADYNRCPLDPDNEDDADLLVRADSGVVHGRVGIGSLCKRTNMVEACKIVLAVAEALPGERFHLWGIDQRLIPLLQRAGVADRVVSFDTSSWNMRFGKDIRRIDAERRRLNLSQRTHADSVLLPRYARRIDGRLSQQTLGI